MLQPFSFEVLINDIRPKNDRNLQNIKITCVDGIAQYLYFGTSKGFVIRYIVDQGLNDEPLYSKLDTYVKLSSADKPIDYLSICCELQLIFIIKSAKIVLLEMDTLKVSEMKTPKISNIICCSRIEYPDEYTIYSVRYAIVTRKKVLFIINLTALKCVIEAEFQLTDQPISIGIINHSILMAYENKYNIFDYNQNKFIELFDIETDVKPLIKIINDNSFFINGPTNNMGMFISCTGIPVDAPLNTSCKILDYLNFENFYFIISPDSISIYGQDNKTIIQQINITDILYIRLFDTILIAISSTGVNLFKKVPIKSQIQSLLANNQIEVADELLVNLLSREDSSEFDQIKFLVKTHLVILKLSQGLFSVAKEIMQLNNIDVIFIIQLLPYLTLTQTCHPRDSYQTDLVQIIKTFLTENSTYADAYKDVLSGILASYRLKEEYQHELTDIDTALLKLYVDLKSDDLYDFVRNENHSIFNESESYLRRKNELFALAFYIFRRGKQAEAIEIWKNLAFNRENSTRNDLFDNYYQIILEYLTRVSDEKLFWATIDWCFSMDKEQGITAFIELINNPNVIFQVDQNKILSFLERYPNSLAVFLKYLIEEKKTCDSNIHNQYAILLLTQVITNYEIDKIIYQNKKILLNEFLRNSYIYNPSNILMRISNHSYLDEERVIVLSKLGHHQEALSILVDVLDDVDAAIKYCLEIKSNLKGSITQSSLFLKVLHLCMRKEVYEKYLPYTIHILNNFGQYIDSIKLIELVPKELTISSVKNMLTDVLFKQRVNVFNRAVERCFTDKYALNKYESLYELSSKRITLTEDSYCDICGKYFIDTCMIYMQNGNCIHEYCDPDNK